MMLSSVCSLCYFLFPECGHQTKTPCHRGVKARKPDCRRLLFLLLHSEKGFESECNKGNTLFFIRIYFIRILRLKFAKFKDFLTINPRPRFEKKIFFCVENL